jgi:signal transduction histidine kinase
VQNPVPATQQDWRALNTADVKTKGTDRAAQAEAMKSAAGLDILSALRTGIVCVLPDGTISAVNDAAAEALCAAGTRHVGTDFWSAFPALHDGRAHDQIQATLRDGAPRLFHAALPGGRADAMHEIRVARTRAGWLIFEMREAAPVIRDTSGEESDPLRDVARRMAAGSDCEALLAGLCDTTLEICGADGAAVAKLVGTDAIVVAASGLDAPSSGTFFSVADSLAGNALRTRSLVAEQNNPPMAWPLLRSSGPIADVLVAPLISADQPVGLFVAWRAAGSATFSTRDRNRLRSLADHAAVALVKARLLEQAQAATHAKGIFLTTISHELRTPLTALTGYGELLADEILGPLSSHQMDMVDRMRSVTHQLAVMVDELLTFSALEAGRDTIRASDVSIVEIMDAVIAIIEPLSRQKELRLSVDLPERPPVLHTDAEKARQILVNLVGNAVKFTDRGEVAVKVGRRNGELTVEVRDTGVGISAIDRARLFQPFTQLDSGLTRRYGGTGLGLYNSGRLAHLLGGRIDVASELGVGSTFTLVVPIRYSGSG